jgi:hypothetical protein
MINRSVMRQFSAYLTAIMLSLFVLPNIAFAQTGLPTFSKEFMPDTIGPGSTTELVFTIDNFGAVPVDELAFTDNLPGGLNLAAPAFVSNSCSGTVSAPDGGSAVSLVNGMLGTSQTCEIIVNVTGAGMGAYTNTTGDLTSSAGNSGKATANLAIDDELPGFSKSFEPSTVEFGGRSTLTFTIDNTTDCGECASVVPNLDFVDNLPPGMVVADPANAVTDCGTEVSPPTLTAVPGTSVISLDANGTFGFPALDAEATCTVTADVIGSAVGSLGNVSGGLLVNFEDISGKATAVLEVTGVEDLLELSKEFINDPVPPGGTVSLEFSVTNKSRSDSATGISFSDDLEATLTGLAPVLPPIPDPPCGAGSSLSYSLGVLTLAGGTLPPEGVCTFTVELGVPAGANPGTYPNTTDPVAGDIGGSTETGNAASDLLFIVSYPILTKEFTDDPVGAGDNVILEFSITNPDSGLAMTDIEFADELTDGSGDGEASTGFLPFPVNVTLPPIPDPPCGAGSSLALVFFGDNRQGLVLTGGSLVAGASCTFSVTVDIPVGLSGGTYLNTTEEITALLDGVAVTGPPASDTLVVASAPRLTKNFIDDPVTPGGGPVTLEFNLTYAAGSTADATAIAFTDDLMTLAPAVPGLVAASVNSNTCPDSTVDISTPTLIDFSGGTLTPGESCVVSMTLTVPAASPVGAHTNTTSDITATVDGVAASNTPGEDDLVITSLVFTKEFTDDPVIPGDTATLRLTIENIDPIEDATGIMFTDDLSAILPGTPDIEVVSFPATPCGGTLSSVTPTFLIFAGGNVPSGLDCSFDVLIQVPAVAADGVYRNITSNISSSLGTDESATDTLTIESTLLELTKEFIDDPVNPDGPVTLEFNLTNLSSTETVTDIAFEDDLAATLAGLAATSVDSNDCAGSTVDISTSTLIDFSGGTLTPGQSCVVSLTLSVPVAPLPGSVFPNTTTDVTGKVGLLDVSGEPASDNLLVTLIDFSKSFNGPTTASETVELRFTIENLDSVNVLDGLSFSDNLDDVLTGLVATVLPTTPCGTGSSLSGTSFLSLTGGNLPAGGSCTFVVDLLVPADSAIGDFTNTTSELFSFGLIVDLPATADLTILGTVGGAVSGLAGSGLVLSNNGEDIPIPLAGPFDFTFAPQADGSTYDVIVKTQPTDLSQTCTVSDGNGKLAGASVTDLVVTCVTDTFSVGGSVSGLAGSGLVLSNNGEDIPIPLAGPFDFTFAPQADGSAYDVMVSTQPTDLSQTCTVSNGSGTLAGADITTVAITCATGTFSVGGSVSGLAGSGLVLSNNGQDIPIPLAGPFDFTFAPQTDGSAYDVTVKTQPTDLSQTCTVSNGSGTLAGASITDVVVTCVTDTFSVGGSVSGLDGSGLVLTNNGNDINIPLAGPYDFTFPPQSDGSAYAVTVKTQPTDLSQTCTVSNGAGVIDGNSVLNIAVNCSVSVINIAPVPGLNKFGLLLLILAMTGILVWRQTRITGGQLNEQERRS